MKPIRQLAHAKTKWNWTEVHETAFTEIKSMITSTQVLAYYDPDKSLEIHCDSSQSGLGSVLMQEGRPVSYANRALTPGLQRQCMHKLKKKWLPSFIQ